MSTDEELIRLRVLLQQLMPEDRENSPLAAWLVHKSLLIPEENGIEKALEAERINDVLELVYRFKTLDQKLTTGEKLPKDWRSKAKPKRYQVSLVYQLFYKEGPSVQLDTARECEILCEDWERQGLRTGWLPQVDRAPLKELVSQHQYHCAWQAPDGMMYTAKMPQLFKETPRSVEWTSIQRAQRYWREVQRTATGVVAGVLRGTLKRQSVEGPSWELDIWITAIGGETLESTQGETFRKDVRGVLISRGFSLGDFDSWKETDEKLRVEPKLSETNSQVTEAILSNDFNVHETQ